MPLRMLPFVVFTLIGTVFGLIGTVVSAQPTSVAITTTLRDSQTQTQQDRANAFLDLLEVQLSQNDSIILVERMRIETALQEQLISQTLGTPQHEGTPFGKLLSADLILNAQFLSAEGEIDSTQMIVRVVEAKTGTIRGVSIAAVDEISVEESAVNTARYLSAVVESPSEAAITVAVAAFQCEARFVRLRPLELGIRDILTAELLNHRRFHVLQRSQMSDLVREMELIQAGFVDLTSLPVSLPERSAGYFVTGTLNEHNANGSLQIDVSGQVNQAGQQEPILAFGFQTTPSQLPHELSLAAMKIAGVLSKAARLPEPPRLAENHRSAGAASDETRRLLDQVLHDLYRFRPRSPISGGERSFRVPGIDLREKVDANAPKYESRGYWASVVSADTPLGTHLLRKSIDRLETILFIDPDHAVAAYALAFCFSHHIDGIVNHDRAGELLRQVTRQNPNSDLAAAALHLLSGIGRHHAFGISRPVAPNLSRMSTENVQFAFETMPPQHRDYRWGRILNLLSARYLQPEDIKSLMPVLRIVAKRIDEVDDAMLKRLLATESSRIARLLDTREAEALIANWTSDENRWKRHAGCLYFAESAAREREYAEAAKWYEQAASGFAGMKEHAERHAFENLLIHAAEYWRRADRVDAAMKVLDSFSPSLPRSLNRGYYDLQRGYCLQQLGQDQQAVATWVRAAESVPHLINQASVAAAIKSAGGVPLSPDREINVRYLANADKFPNSCVALATDGSRVFCAGRGKQGYQCFAFDIATESWTTIKAEIGRITCMDSDAGSLWVGTDDEGLYRYDIASQQWHHWGLDESLPDLHIESLRAVANECYVGVGTARGGGLVKINADGSVRFFEGKDAPDQAPTHIIVSDEKILARSIKSIRQYDQKIETWSPLELTSLKSPFLFPADIGYWASTSQRELYPLEQPEIPQDWFKQAWYPPGRQKAGYQVKFIIEHKEEIWFGGTPYEKFLCSGLYRVNKHTGDFSMYGPRDGFKMDRYYTSDDGVWAADRLWIATHAGLAEVTKRPHVSEVQSSDN